MALSTGYIKKEDRGKNKKIAELEVLYTNLILHCISHLPKTGEVHQVYNPVLYIMQRKAKEDPDSESAVYHTHAVFKRQTFLDAPSKDRHFLTIVLMLHRATSITSNQRGGKISKEL